MMRQARGVLLALLVLWVTAGCETMVGDYAAGACDPDPPAACADLGDSDAQHIGCCDEKAVTVWFCADGGLYHLDCGDLTCDYNPDVEAMACVE